MTASLTETLVELGQLLLALVLALPIAINRERHTRIMGIRTFPLVALGTCAIVIIAKSFLGDDDPGAQARIIQGILSGVGFVGGGAILKHRDQVRGTECAAGIWITGAIGAGVAYGCYSVAIALSAISFLVFYGLSSLKQDPE